MARFDETIFPTVEEIREWCVRHPEEEVGVCMNPSACLVAYFLADRLPTGTHITVYPHDRVVGMAFLSCDNPESEWPDEHALIMPNELNILACRFDNLGGEDDGIVGSQVVSLCDQIIAERSAA